jgi:hypothetical protein
MLFKLGETSVRHLEINRNRAFSVDWWVHKTLFDDTFSSFFFVVLSNLGS